MAVNPGALIGAATGLASQWATGKQKRAAEQERERALAEEAARWEGIEVPDIKDLQYQAAQERYMGDIAAPDVYLPKQITSEMAGITTDPRFREAQVQSLGALDQIIEGVD
jgi:hypothetical protein